MNKLVLLLPTIVFWISSAGKTPEKMIRFAYEKPYEYQMINGSYKISAMVKENNWIGSRVVSFNGEVLPVKQVNDSVVQVSLPLIGNPGFLQITQKENKNKSVQEQYFEPLIPADWDYFKEGKIHVISSSHQDIAWMNTPDSCRHERVFDIILPALDFIEREPAFKFEMEQSLNLMEVLEDSPESRQRIIEAYKTGNFEWGATFNQPYEGLESSEQLVRQAYLGRRWIKKELPGMDAIVAYNTDVPGRSLQVPQIYKKSGIDYLFVSRMKEGFYNWYSPDGTKIFTYSPGNYIFSKQVYKYLEEDAITALHKLHKALKNWNEYYRERNLPPHYGLVMSSDASVPKHYKEVIEGWNKIVKNSGLKIPEIQHSSATEFFRSVDVPGIKIDSIYGERPNLWLYIHGAAHYQAIKAKRAAAVYLPAAEKFNTINCKLKNDFTSYPQEALSEAWHKSIFPDHGWGGRNGHITDSIFRLSLEQGEKLGEKLLNSALNDITDKINLEDFRNILVFNDLSWNRDGYATVDISDLKGTDWIIESYNGEIIPAQVVSSDSKKELVFSLKNIPSVGYSTFAIKKGENQIPEIKVGANYSENQFYSLKLDKGGITALYDKKLQKDVFNTTRMVGGDLIHMGYDGYGAGEFVQITEPNYILMEHAHEKESSWKLVESGAVYSKFKSEYSMRNFSVEQIITVYHQKKQIDLEYNIPDWPGEHNRQLRVLFPLNMEEGAQISYDVPMGMVHVGKDELKMRPKGYSWRIGTYRQMPEEIRPREIQNFMTANGDGIGFTMSTNLVTADWIDPGRGSVDYPVLNSVLLSSHKSCHKKGNWYDQKGSHSFKFSISSHHEGWKNAFHFGVECNHPFSTLKRFEKQKGNLPAEKSFINISNPFAVLTALKKAEDNNDMIIRIQEAEGMDKNIEVNFYEDLEKIYKTNMIEDNPVKINKRGNNITLQLSKYSIETYKVN